VGISAGQDGRTGFRGRKSVRTRHRMTTSHEDREPESRRGTVIAFVGSEATGKSTLIRQTEQWLSADQRVRRIHAGKPPSTVITFVPHVLLPALRMALPRQRSTRVTSEYDGAATTGDKPYPLIFGVRSVMLAYERRALLRRAFAWSARGTIVLSDRYPSSRSGSLDSPQLGHRRVGDRAVLRRWLATLEARLYRAIPVPDLVIQLTAPLDVTLARNLARAKTEAEDYVRFRYSLTSHYQFDGVAVHQIDTDRPLEAVFRDVHDAIQGHTRARAKG
jgi:thymidylate kinase